MEDFDVRAALVVGESAAVLFDTLAHPAQLEAVPALVADLPLTVVYSHADWDHAWGTCALTAVREVVAHEAAVERFRTDVPGELARRVSVDPTVWRPVRLVPPSRAFTGRLGLDLGGVTLELHALPGHTPDCLVGFIPQWGVLLAGDTVETPLPVVNDGAAVRGWVDALAPWLVDERVGMVVPSHGRVGGRELLADTMRYLQGLARGEAPADPGASTPFYRRTHRLNVERVRAAPTS